MAILRKPEHFWPALWLALLAVLCAVLAAEHFLGGVEVGGGVRAPARVVEAKLLPPFALAGEAEAAPETVARPLFVPTRRPSPPLAAATASAIKRGQFLLTGVTVTPDAAFAFLREHATGKTHSVRKGSTVNGLTVDKVEPRRVVLRQGEEIEDLTLHTRAPARIAAAPAPSAAVPPAPGAAAVPAPAGSVANPVFPGTMAVPASAGAPGSPPARPGAAPAASAAAQPGTTPAAPGTPPPATGRRRPWITAQ